MSDVASGVGFYVRCPGCGGFFHETTEEFTQERPASGVMFKLLDQFGPKGANWSSFPRDDAYRFDSLTCPGCGAPYTCGGSYVQLVPKNEDHTIEDQRIDQELTMEYMSMIDFEGMLQSPEWKNTNKD